MFLVGVVDTTFARVNMGLIALDVLSKYGEIRTVSSTVPGVKDLPVACKKLLDGGCDLALALGMVGNEPIDKQCAHEASTAIQTAMLMTNKHILEVFVHEDEGKNNADLLSIFKNRTQKHAHNAARMLLDPYWFTRHAGLGMRQGRNDVGGLQV